MSGMGRKQFGEEDLCDLLEMGQWGIEVTAGVSGRVEDEAGRFDLEEQKEK